MVQGSAAPPVAGSIATRMPTPPKAEPGETLPGGPGSPVPTNTWSTVTSSGFGLTSIAPHEKRCADRVVVGEDTGAKPPSDVHVAPESFENHTPPLPLAA